MNKHLYRVLFNEKRGQLVAVSEITSTESGNSKGRESERTSSPALSSSSWKLSFTQKLLVLALNVCVPMLVHATPNIAADKSAPHFQQPIIMESANGTPLINIQTPTAKGVSINLRCG